MMWNDWQYEKLVELAKNGELSAGMIGQQVGKTRNAVIGKLRRLNIERAFIPKIPKPRSRKEPKPVFFQPPVELMPLGPEEPSPETAVELVDLERGHCRYPTEGNKYCGGNRVRGAYCAFHAERCYQ